MSDMTIEQLSIEVNSNAEKATSGIDALAASLEKLKSSLGDGLKGLDSVNSSLNGVATNASKASNTIQKSFNKSNKSIIGALAGFDLLKGGFNTLTGAISNGINEYNKYIENLNLVRVAMGETGNAAEEFANKYAEVLGLDPADMIRNFGVFDIMLKSFGLASEAADKMSKNLTQLGYDIGSLYNIPFAEAMTKIQSGIAGQTRPLRQLGIDLSNARLQQEALAYGITKSVSAMTQSEKAQLRYNALLKQTTLAQGDLARTINTPANQLRILQAQVTQCARAFGSIFMPILQAVLPVVIAVAKAIRFLLEAFAKLIGWDIGKALDVDYGAGIGAGAVAAEDLADNAGNAGKALKDAGEKAKKLKDYLLGIDELNVIRPDDDEDDPLSKASGAGGAGGIGGGGLDIPLEEYDWDKYVKEQVDKISEALKPVLELVEAIGVGFLAWKVAEGLINTLDKVKNFLAETHVVDIEFKVLGLAMFLADLKEFMRYFNDLKENGATFHNVEGMISEFVGLVGDSLVLMGRYDIGGALKLIQGIGEIVNAIEDISRNGVNWDNALTAIRGLTNIAIGIGLFTGNLKVAAWSVAIQGFSTVIREIADNWEAIKQGDWSGVDKVALAVGALEIIGGVAVALDAFSKIKAVSKAGKATEAAEKITEVATATDTVSTTVKSKLAPKLIELTKNLMLGIVVITEVIAAAALIVGGIALLGAELQLVAKAWQPVIDNGATVAIAMGLGLALLAGVGAVTALLGNVGKELAMNMLVGIAILAEIGIAAGLFVAEILVIGILLGEVGKAWQPVLDNGNTVATAIGLGTALLIAIGVVTALLGAATVATAGALPLAIGLGTAILIELGVAAGLFIKEVEIIGGMLVDLGNAWQPVLNNGDTIATGIAAGTALLIGIGVVTAALGVATVASVGLLPVAIGLGTALLVELSAALVLFVNELSVVASELSNRLAPALDDLNGKLPDMTTNMSNFVDFMEKFAEEVGRYTQSSGIAALGGAINSIVQFFTGNPIDVMAGEVEKVGQQTGSLNGKLETANSELEQAIELLTNYTGFIEELGSIAGSGGGTVALSEGLKPNLEKVGQDIVTGFADGIRNNFSAVQSALTDWGNEVHNGMTTTARMNPESFNEYGKNVPDGVAQGISDNTAKVTEAIASIINEVQNAFGKGNNNYELTVTLVKQGWDSIKGWIGDVPVIEQQIALAKRNWNTVRDWIGNIPDLDQGIKLVKRGWNTVRDWIGNIPDLDQGIKLKASGWTTVAKWVGDPLPDITQYVRLQANGWSTVENWLGAPSSIDIKVNLKQGSTDPGLSGNIGRAKGGYYNNNFWNYFANGGFISGGRTRGWGIPTYGKGGITHGSMFVAGEAGAEMVGHINGQTEVLNQSQIKLAMKSAVVSGMANFTPILNAINSNIVNCSNAVINSILKSSQGVYEGIRYLDTYDPSKILAQNTYDEASMAYKRGVKNEDYYDMRDLYREYIEPTLKDIAADTKRQADKEEQTIVQVGNRVVTDAVEIQKRANGYNFIAN